MKFFISFFFHAAKPYFVRISCLNIIGKSKRNSILLKYRIRTLASLLLLWIITCATAHAFSFSDVADKARKLSEASFSDGSTQLPPVVSHLSYDQYRDIRFNPPQAMWRDAGLPFELRFFHRGPYAIESIKINEIDGETVREITFSPSMFNYGANQLPANQLRNLGFAGFKAYYPLNAPKRMDEALVFLGASYFRALGEGQRYGLSARGLSVDTAKAGAEEFPRFREFWIVKPSSTDQKLVVYALLDSRRVSGAYCFVLQPGSDTVLDVKARLYLRETIDNLGIAPLTSMYLHGENQPATNDYRPNVHDSDGLSIQSGDGEWIWRPLVNPKQLLVTSFTLPALRGFGLMQRDRNFASYEDLETRYELRPSAWITPIGDWGAGRVELVQIPSSEESDDNIVAYWVPATPPGPGKPLDIAYRIFWQRNSETIPSSSHVIQTRRGNGYLQKRDGSIAFTVDFDGPALRQLAVDATLRGIVDSDGNGRVLERNVYRNEVTGGWRMTVRLRRLAAAQPVELRAFLSDGAHALSETWSYVIPPE
jgi:glucans biosynthesis protein